MSILGDRLKSLRLSRGYTMDELAAAYNERYPGHLDKGACSRYESGGRKPRLSTLENLADFYGVSIDYLTGKSDDPRRTEEFAPYGDLLRLLDDIKNGRGEQPAYVLGLGGKSEFLTLNELEYQKLKRLLKKIRAQDDSSGAEEAEPWTPSEK